MRANESPIDLVISNILAQYDKWDRHHKSQRTVSTMRTQDYKSQSSSKPVIAFYVIGNF